MTISDTIVWDDKEYKLIWHDVDNFDDIRNKKLQQIYGVCFYKDKLVIGGNDNNKWSLIGGHIESGETPEEALIREVQEESNMRVIKQIPLGYQEVINPDGIIGYQLRSFCLVEPIREFIKDPVGSVTKIKLIDPKTYKKYFDWGKVGDRMMELANKFLHKYS